MKRISWVAAIAVFIGGGAFYSQAALTPLGGEYPLLGNITGHQQNPHAAANSDGGFVVWQNATANSKGERVLVQRLNADLGGAGAPLVASQNLANINEVHPRVALLPDGSGVVTWEAGARGATDVFVRFLDANGNFTSGITRANTFATGVQSDADVAVLPDGTVMVVWTSLGQDGDGEGVYGQRFTSRGVRDGAEFLINQSTARNQSMPNVAALNGDRFVVCWVSESVNGRNNSGAANLRANLMARLFNAGGTPTGNEYRLNDGDVVVSGARLAAGANGGFTVAWVQTDEKNMNNLSDIYVKSFDNAGLPTAAAKKHNTYLRGRQEDPELAVLGNDALVAWTSFGQDAGGAGIQGRMVKGGAEFAVNSQGNLHQKAPVVITNGANKYLALWVNTIKADHSILAAQRYISSEGAVAAGVKDVTAGEVNVVGAEVARRKTNTKALKTPPQPESVATMSLAAPPPPPAANPAAKRIAAAEHMNGGSAATKPQVANNSMRQPAPTPTPANNATARRPGNTRLSNAAETALQSMARMRQGAPNRINMRRPGMVRNNSSAYQAQSSLLQQARSRTQGLQGTRPGMLRPTGLYGQRPGSTQPSLSRMGMLRQPQQPTQMAGLTQNTRGFSTAQTTRSTRLGPQMTRSNLRVAPSSSSVFGRPGQQVARNSTRQPNSAMNRMEFLRNRGNSSTAAAQMAAAQPVNASLAQSGRDYYLRYQSQSGSRYQVQSSNDQSNWRNVGGVRSGRGGTDSVRVVPGSAKYYRVVRSN